MKKIKILLLGIVSVFLLLGTAFAIEATPADREAIEKVCRQYLLDYDAAYLLGKEPTTDYFRLHIQKDTLISSHIQF